MMSGGIEIDGELRHETERAYLFNDGKATVWLPKKLCSFVPEKPSSDSGVMSLPEWLASEKGLI